jgi:hypothetical protein
VDALDGGDERLHHLRVHKKIFELRKTKRTDLGSTLLLGCVYAAGRMALSEVEKQEFEINPFRYLVEAAGETSRGASYA